MARHATGVSLLPVRWLIDVEATVGLTDTQVWSGLRPNMERSADGRSRPWSSGMARWCSAPAGGSSGTITTRWTRFR